MLFSTDHFIIIHTIFNLVSLFLFSVLKYKSRNLKEITHSPVQYRLSDPAENTQWDVDALPGKLGSLTFTENMAHYCMHGTHRSPKAGPTGININASSTVKWVSAQAVAGTPSPTPPDRHCHVPITAQSPGRRQPTEARPIRFLTWDFYNRIICRKSFWRSRNDKMQNSETTKFPAPWRKPGSYEQE